MGGAVWDNLVHLFCVFSGRASTLRPKGNSKPRHSSDPEVGIHLLHLQAQVVMSFFHRVAILPAHLLHYPFV
jgi:hypothetical protein